MAGTRRSTPSSDGDPDPDDTLVARAADDVYALDPAEFMSRRTELARQAKDAGGASVAKRITALRKPTVAASIVNRLVLHDPSTVDDLLELSGRMRAAQDALDASLLRELSGERRALVSRLTEAALAQSAITAPSSTVRDEITSTLDAAIADEGVAARLGRLERSESWSGFGFTVGGSPELTLVRGGRDTTRRRKPTPGAKPADPPAAKSADKPAPAARRRLARALDKARGAFEAAEASLTDAEQSEQSEAEHVRELTGEIADLQHQLTDTKQRLDRARREAKAARARRREARSALDRAERQSDA